MAEIVKIFSPTATLRAMKPGESLEIKVRLCKPSTVRSQVGRLNRKGGCKFICTESNLPSSVRVTRIK